MIRAILLALLGVASFGTVYWATGDSEREAAPQAAGMMSPAPPPSSALSSGRAAEPVTTASVQREPLSGLGLRAGAQMQIAQIEGEGRARTVRDVTPEDMTAVPTPSAPPERSEAAPPTAAAAPKPARRERLFNPLIDAAGTIRAGGHVIRLKGIAATEPERTCGEANAAWPCGRMARAALRSFVRGRAIECDVPAGADTIPDPATCTVGGDDIAAWLVAQGWAELSGDAYREAGKAAKDSQRGLYSATRPDTQVATRP